jgi:hypothetical protein
MPVRASYLTTASAGSSYGPSRQEECEVAGPKRKPPTKRKLPEFPPDFDADAVQALARLVDKVIQVPRKRHEFKQDPIGVAKRARVPVTPKMERVIFTLAEMSPSELRLLSDFNRLLIAEGLYVETGNPPIMVY